QCVLSRSGRPDGSREGGTMATPLRSQPRVDGTMVPELLDQRHLAERLQITERHVRRLVAERRIPFVKVGRFVRFDPEEIAAWIDGQRVPTEGRSRGVNWKN